jgi:hypothetical protein
VAKPPTFELPSLDVPDLELPSVPSGRPAPSSGAPSAFGGDSDPFGAGIVRGEEAIAPAPIMSQPQYGKSMAVDFGAASDDPFGGEIEHGSGMEIGPSLSGPTSGPRPVSSRAPASMKLELAEQRELAPSFPGYEPSKLEKIGGRAIALAGMGAALYPLVRYLHYAGKFSLVKRVPHAFDATSLVQAGIFGGVFLVTSIAMGYLGIRARPRSKGMILSGLLLLIGLLAQVTIALISTDEQPEPPDAGRLIPYLIPGAFILLGFGIAGRGQEPYYDGGARRVLPFVYGLIGGAVAFAGICLSNY